MMQTIKVPPNRMVDKELKAPRVIRRITVLRTKVKTICKGRSLLIILLGSSSRTSNQSVALSHNIILFCGFYPISIESYGLK